MRGTHLSASDIKVMHSDGDADVDIVSSALTIAYICSVTSLGEETDLLFLRLWQYNPSLHHPEHLYSNSNKTAAYIKMSKQLIGQDLTQSVLEIHAF